jgi:mRNA-degrading endonuclease toxin of MazEF toxin-antitoxin module
MAAMPGNVRLRRCEAGLFLPGVVNVSQLRTVDRTRLVDRAGVLGPARLREVLKGISLLFGTEDAAQAES